MDLSREQVVLAVLQFDLANGYDLRIVSEPDETWLAHHGGGFSPICEIEAGDFYEVCPARVVEMGAHLSDEQFVRFVEAIRAWQKGSLLFYAFGVDPTLVVARFGDRRPEEARLLMAIASHHGIDPVSFFGAARGQRCP